MICLWKHCIRRLWLRRRSWLTCAGIILLPSLVEAQDRVQLRSETQHFQQSSTIQPYAIPGAIGLTSQMEQPELLPPPDGVLIQPGEHQGPLYEALNHPPEIVLAPQEYNSDGTLKLSPFKKGFFQKLSLSAAWLGDGDNPAD